MPPASAACFGKTVPVLCVDPIEEDHATLEDIFHSSPWSICPDSSWALEGTRTLTAAWRALHTHRYALVLCERDLRPGTWRELLELLAHLQDPPSLIVTSRSADEHLWAEALNLGAHDVLAKPFDRSEVIRVVSMAWMHWMAQHSVAAETNRVVAGLG